MISCKNTAEERANCTTIVKSRCYIIQNYQNVFVHKLSINVLIFNKSDSIKNYRRSMVELRSNLMFRIDCRISTV